MSKQFDYEKAAADDGFKLKLTALELEALVEFLDEAHKEGALDGNPLQQVRADTKSFLAAFCPPVGVKL